MLCLFCETQVELTDEGYYCPICYVFVPPDMLAEWFSYEVANAMQIALEEDES